LFLTVFLSNKNLLIRVACFKFILVITDALRLEDPSKLSLADRVRMFNGLSSSDQQRNVVSRPPRAAAGQQPQQQQQLAAAAARRGGRRKLNRFQTQPITVDEVEKARRGFFSYQAPAQNND
jgi:hypothetical protein